MASRFDQQGLFSDPTIVFPILDIHIFDFSKADLKDELSWENAFRAMHKYEVHVMRILSYRA
jgi:hypothetical protein